MESARCPSTSPASPATTRPSCLLPGDPNRATRIAARFDGGLDASPARHGAPWAARVHGDGRRRPGLGPDDDDGHAHDDDRRGGAADARRHDVHPRRDDRRLSAGSAIGDAVVAMSAAALSGRRRDRSGSASRPPRPPTSTSCQALVEASRAQGLVDACRPRGDDRTCSTTRTPTASRRWGRRGYLSAEMETAALYLLAMRERAKGRPVRAGCDPHGLGRDRGPDVRAGGHDDRRRDLVPAARGRGHPARRPHDRRGDGRRRARPGLSPPALTLRRRTTARA